MYHGKKIKLRGLELSDIDNIMSFWNDLELRKYLNTMLPQSKQEEEEWIRKTWKNRFAGTGYVFAIETHDNEWLGTCSLDNVNPINHSAILGIAIHRKDLWGKGYGTDVVITLCAIGFKILNLNRIELEYFEGNIAGSKVYPRAGFKEIGRKRQARYINGTYGDSIIMDILRADFDALFSDLNLF